MYCPDPPCCAIPGARKNCNKSWCCNGLGKFGVQYFDRNRGCIMLFMASLSFVALILATVSIVSLSKHNDIVKDTYWTFGEVEGTKIYIGVQKVVYETDGHTESFLWESDDCDDTLVGDKDYCDECRAACYKVLRSSIVNFLTLLPAVSGNIKRSTRKGDLNCTKFMTILSGTVSTLTILISIATYQEGCYDNLPDETESGSSITYNLGPGFICLLIPQFIKPVEVIVNILTPVVDEEEQSDLDSNLLL
mmetsp:Transcript_9314/g.14030  ORF Transcript_9314/g.14030 Transcript_9314/m.14030 type:complete len:249 (-) Transcript_9314:45-791(-)